MAGLRRNEIDKLEWSAFDWDRNGISIEADFLFLAEKRGFNRRCRVDPEVMELFQGYRVSASGNFVIESEVLPRLDAADFHYRSQREFEPLNRWLRGHDVEGKVSLFTRSERNIGSQCVRNMEFMLASRALPPC